MKVIGIAPKRAGLALAVLATGCAVAACGSTSSSSTTSASSPTSTTSSGGGVNRTAFRTCMQQHGVTLPNRRPGGAGGGPPGGGGAGAGGFFGGGGGGGQFSNPKVQAALKACGGSFPGRRGGRFQQSHTAVNNFVACVRRNGYPQMPNPNFSGTGPVFPSSIRSNSKFQTASRACQNLLVPSGRASGTSTTTGA